MALIELDAEQARVLASLVEKSITTPNNYPLSLNSLTAACNQKSSRNPVMTMSEGAVGSALISLEELGLAARDDSGARVTRWRHRITHSLRLEPTTQAVLVALMLRGPQTVAELRANAAPLKGPADNAGVEAALEDLEDRGEPLVVPAPRGAGQKGSRYMHRLCGEPDFSQFELAAPPASRTPSSDRLAELEQRIAALEARLDAAGL